MLQPTCPTLTAAQQVSEAKDLIFIEWILKQQGAVHLRLQISPVVAWFLLVAMQQLYDTARAGSLQGK